MIRAGVDPDLGHVEELHVVGVLAEGVPEQVDPRAAARR